MLLDGSGSMCMSSTTTHKGVAPLGMIAATGGHYDLTAAQPVWVPSTDPCPTTPDIHFQQQLRAAETFLAKIKAGVSVPEAPPDAFRAAAAQFSPPWILDAVAAGDPQYLVHALSTDVDAVVASVTALGDKLAAGKTFFAPALVACVDQLAAHAGAPANTFRACVLISDGVNSDHDPWDADVYHPGNKVYPYCQQEGISPCTATAIATHIKASGTTIIGVFVGDVGSFMAESMYAFADCAAYGDYAASNSGADCPNFLDVSFAEFDAKATALADSLVASELKLTETVTHEEITYEETVVQNKTPVI